MTNRFITQKNVEIDIIMPTYNSNSLIFPYILYVLSKIPWHHFIIVDRFSTDGTIEVVKRYIPRAVIVRSDFDLALARKLGALIADTEIVCYIDSDVFPTLEALLLLYKIPELLLKTARLGIISFAICAKEPIATEYRIKVSRIIIKTKNVPPKEVLLKTNLSNLYNEA